MARKRASVSAKKRAAATASSEATAAAEAVEATSFDATADDDDADDAEAADEAASIAPEQPTSPPAQVPTAVVAATLPQTGGLLVATSSTDVSPTSSAVTATQVKPAALDEDSPPAAVATEAATMGDIPAAFMNRQASQTRANGKTAAMSKQRLHRTSLVEKMTASAAALRKASIASTAFPRSKKQQTKPLTKVQSIEDDTPTNDSSFDLATLLKEADSNMAEAVITAPTTPIRAAVVDNTLSSTESAAVGHDVTLATSASSTTATATGATGTAVAIITGAAAIDTVVSDEQRLLEGSRVRLPRSPLSAQTAATTANSNDGILSDNEDDMPKSMPTLHQSFGDSEGFLSTLYDTTSANASTTELLPAVSYSAGHRHPVTRRTTASTTTAASNSGVTTLSTKTQQLTLSNSNILQECCGSVVAVLKFVPIVTAVVASIVVLDVGM
jgi:hypothetical protein